MRLLASVAVLAGVLCLFAQSPPPSRDEYRAAYKSWRQADPDLEREAVTAGEALAPRTIQAAAAVAAYSTARSAFLRDWADRHAENLQWLREAEVRPLPALAPAPDLLRATNREISSVGTSISRLADDPDRAIQQLRQAFQREQTALETLKTAIEERQKIEDSAAKTALAVEQSRAAALEQYPLLAQALARSADLMNQETPAWAAYYPALAEASRTASTTPAPRVSSAPVSNSQSEAARAVASVEPAPVVAPHAPSVTPLPLSRYVGVWAYQAAGPFHGTEPETVDVTVREENGRATGTLSARFKLPAGSTGDPVVRFDFSGDFRATRNQRFTLQTSDGAMGTVDIIPGGAFNELEVNFDIAAKPGKVRQGDVLLVKQ